MNQELIERPASSVRQCLSTTTIEEKEEPFLSVSVTIRPGVDNSEETAECMKSEKDEIKLGEREESAIMAENPCKDEEEIIHEDEVQVEGEEKDVQKKEITAELLPGWKGYSSNIYIQPIIVKTSKEERRLQKKQSDRVPHHISVHEIRRQMQLRQASEWITKHNQRIYLRGSLKVGEIPSRLRRTPNESGRTSQSSQTSYKSIKSSTKSTSPRMCPNNTRLPKTRLAKGFACRSWPRDYFPDPPRPVEPTLTGALSVRSYVNLGDSFWRENPSKNVHKSDNKPLITNKLNKTRSRIDNKDCTTDLKGIKNNEITDEKVYDECGSESTTTSEESTVSDSVDLADVLFKSVSLHPNRNSFKNCTANLPVVDTKCPQQETDKPRTVASAESSFPPLVNGCEKHCGSSKSRVHRPKTVNLTFGNSARSSAVTNGDGLRRSHSSVISKSF